MPKGPKGEHRPADVIGAAMKVMRMHRTLHCSPAMAAGLTGQLWSIEDMVALIDACKAAPVKHGPYKKAKQNDDAYCD